MDDLMSNVRNWISFDFGVNNLKISFPNVIHSRTKDNHNRELPKTYRFNIMYGHAHGHVRSHTWHP